MSDQHDFLSGDPYSRYQAAEHTLNTAITQAKISESFEEYLEIFDKFYADDVELSSEGQQEPIRGKARVGSLLLNFLVPPHVMAELWPKLGVWRSLLKRPQFLAMLRMRYILLGHLTSSARPAKLIR